MCAPFIAASDVLISGDILIVSNIALGRPRMYCSNNNSSFASSPISGNALFNNLFNSNKISAVSRQDTSFVHEIHLKNLKFISSGLNAPSSFSFTVLYSFLISIFRVLYTSTASPFKQIANMRAFLFSVHSFAKEQISKLSINSSKFPFSNFSI